MFWKLLSFIFTWDTDYLKEAFRVDDWISREEADYDLRAITGDLTPAEMAKVIQIERETYNYNQAATWHTGVDGYYDYDGNWVKE